MSGSQSPCHGGSPTPRAVVLTMLSKSVPWFTATRPLPFQGRTCLIGHFIYLSNFPRGRFRRAKEPRLTSPQMPGAGRHSSMDLSEAILLGCKFSLRFLAPRRATGGAEPQELQFAHIAIDSACARRHSPLLSFQLFSPTWKPRPQGKVRVQRLCHLSGFVIPAKEVIQDNRILMDSRFRGNDGLGDFLQEHQDLKWDFIFIFFDILSIFISLDIFPHFVLMQPNGISIS